MSSLFIVHLNHSGKEKQVVKKETKSEDVMEYIVSRNKGSLFLKNEQVETFLVDDSLDDGVYIIPEDTNYKVFKIETMIFDGYLYGSSTYRMRKLVNEYEVIKGDCEE